ncbi:hypothetical protein [Micromonospora sp. M71_S20]|uniref:hypothetical protein n=1 Tax=Micromonospora sp. M71_S20 TaxID=592872 RepID=UPI000EAD13F3|nr:hypothetical protein [Micromonospora sp. M71_S20]
MLYAVPAVLVLAATAAPTLPGIAAPAQMVAASPSPDTSYWPHQSDLMDAATRVEEIARQRWAHAFGGVGLDVPGNVLLVHGVPGDRGFAEAVRALVPRTRVRLVDAVHTQAQLDHWKTVIAADTRYWERRGIIINSVGPDIGRCVTVGVEGDADEARPVLVDHYPDVTLCVVQGGRAVFLDLPDG